MKLANFTPGPWMISDKVDGAVVPVEDQMNSLLGLDAEGYCVVMDEPNAHLIAAAPELYAALEQLRFQLEVCDTCLKTWNHTGSPIDSIGAMLLADRALAKARGEA